MQDVRFLSTPSARRATYPSRTTMPSSSISIHALREEGDTKHLPEVAAGTAFLSTPSARRATQDCCVVHVFVTISIHALREEGDSFGLRAFPESEDFYPRPPRGGRLVCINLPVFLFEFLSTPSARRATFQVCHHRCEPHQISIHALREEGDPHS